MVHLCGCGCGEEVINEKNKFINGHNSKKIKIKVYCNYCNKEIFRPISWVGNLNFCCSDHFHLYKKNERKKEVECLNCNSKFYQYQTYLDRRQFCCNNCKEQWYKNNTKAVYCKMCNKLIFGGSFRKELSIFCSEECRNLYRKINNIGDKVQVQCLFCNKSFVKFKVHLSINNFCGNKCQRLYMEKNGFWLPKDQKNDWEIYNEQSHWSRNVFKFLSESDNLLLKQKGIYNSVRNINGVVRDHVYSRRRGFNNKVFVEIIRHPVNCRLITSIENIARHFKNDLPEHQLSLDYLFQKIKNFNKEWKEQDICLKLIDLYEKGERWKREKEIDPQEKTYE